MACDWPQPDAHLMAAATPIQPAAAEDRAVWNDPQAAPYISIESVTKKFGEFVAVNDVSLKIYRGELFCLLGGSGCGKTTLLRMLAGFEEPTTGRISIDGVDMTGIPPYERPVNMMFQSYALFPHMTVEQNVAFGLKQDGLPKREIATRVADMLNLVKLTQFAKRKPHQLSGGQRQRVALARSLVKRPKLLLLDEPLGALDKKLREHTQFELVNLQEQLGVTFMVVTHDQEEAMTLVDAHRRDGSRAHRADRHAEGHLRVSELQASSPSSSATSTCSQGQHDRGRARPRADRDAGDWTARSTSITASALRSDAVVWAAVRPEKIQLSRRAAAAARTTSRAASSRRSPTWATCRIYLVQLGSGKMMRVTQPNAYRHADDASPGTSTVYLHWHASSPVVLLE